METLVTVCLSVLRYSGLSLGRQKGLGYRVFEQSAGCAVVCRACGYALFCIYKGKGISVGRRVLSIWNLNLHSESTFNPLGA